jgi:phosphoglycolate phosphatase-like HAD superfamily hydrolase
MEDAPSKPSPDGIRLAMGELGLANPWMIGDTPDDMNAAVAAGITPIGVAASGLGYDKNRKVLLASGAVVVISDTNDIQRLLN